MRLLGPLKKQLKKSKLILYIYRKLTGRTKTTWGDVERTLANKNHSFLEENPKFKGIHSKLTEINLQQRSNWSSMVYCGGSFYQGYDRIGIAGVKPAEKRLERYDAYRYFHDTSKVLDIGSNAGFMACELSYAAAAVDAVELNPYLNEIGILTAEFLEKNVNFINEDFTKYKTDKKYDVILSLSNHHTIDGNLDIDFERYIKKIFDMSRPGAILLFESHSIWGDDSDLEKKFDICNKYFYLQRFKMVPAFYEPDIDKLFAVFSRREQSEEKPKELDFNLDHASKQYNFVEYK